MRRLDRFQIIEAAAIALILITGGLVSCLISFHLEGRISHHRAVDLQKALQ